VLKKIELTCHEPQSQSIEYVLKKYKLPYNVELAIFEDSKLLQYTAITPDAISRNVIADLNKILDTRQTEIYLISHNIDEQVC
jgi:hypothetical protein